MLAPTKEVMLAIIDKGDSSILAVVAYNIFLDTINSDLFTVDVYRRISDNMFWAVKYPTKQDDTNKHDISIFSVTRHGVMSSEIYWTLVENDTSSL